MRAASALQRAPATRWLPCSLHPRVPGPCCQVGQEPLREAEICNIANIRPTSLVALYAMIDKSLDRFGEPKLNEMLDIIARILTAPPDPEGEGAWVGEEVDSMQT